MTFFITPESFAAACLGADLSLDFSQAPGLRERFETTPLGTSEEVVSVLPREALEEERGAPAARLYVFDGDGEALSLPPSALMRLHEATGGGRAVLLRGQFVFGRSTAQYLFVAPESDKTVRFADLLAGWDPKHRPHLLTATIDFTLPWPGKNAYRCEHYRGYYLRWQGPEPILTIGLAGPITSIYRAGAQAIRIDIHITSLVYPTVLTGLATYLDGVGTPSVIMRRGPQLVLTSFLQPELLAAQIERGAPLDFSVSLPVALKGMPEGKDPSGRSFTFGFSAVEMVGFPVTRAMPIAMRNGPPSIVDTTGPAFELIAAGLEPVGGSDLLRALHAEVDRVAEGPRATVLNATLGADFFHKVQVVNLGSKKVRLHVERLERETTAWGFSYMTASGAKTADLHWKRGALRPAETADWLDGTMLQAAGELSRLADRAR